MFMRNIFSLNNFSGWWRFASRTRLKRFMKCFQTKRFMAPWGFLRTILTWRQAFPDSRILKLNRLSATKPAWFIDANFTIRLATKFSAIFHLFNERSGLGRCLSWGKKISNQHKEARNFLNINFIAQLFLHKTRYKNNNFLACTPDESKTKTNT